LVEANTIELSQSLDYRIPELKGQGCTIEEEKGDGRFVMIYAKVEAGLRINGKHGGILLQNGEVPVVFSWLLWHRLVKGMMGDLL